MDIGIIIICCGHVDIAEQMLFHHPRLEGKTLIVCDNVRQPTTAKSLSELTEELKSIPITNHRLNLEVPTITTKDILFAEKSNYITGKKLPRRNRR